MDITQLINKIMNNMKPETSCKFENITMKLLKNM